MQDIINGLVFYLVINLLLTNIRPSSNTLGDIFVDNVPLFKLYYRYIRNYNKSQGTLSKLTGSDKFREFMKVLLFCLIIIKILFRVDLLNLNMQVLKPF